MKKKSILILLTLMTILVLTLLTILGQFDKLKVQTAATPEKPLRIGIVRLTHTHVHWLLGRPSSDDIKIVGIVEPNRKLAQKYAKEHGYSMDIVFDTMDEMIKKTQPEAVCAFGSIYEHLGVVEKCAPLGIHVMVEKPLAVSMDHAKKMEALAQKHQIQLLTNYETTWYATNRKAWKYLNDENKVGDLRKIVFHTGHSGPIEIGCNPEFTDWLIDPALNGAGVLTDFGCYGADITTWLLKGKKPESVTCITQHIKPDLYPKVEDECTILLTYPKTQVIIEASWNWPFNRKDMEVYGQHGSFICEDRNNLNYRWKNMDQPNKEKIPENAAPYNDPFSFLAAVVTKKITPPAFDLSSLETNMIVMEILEAAKESAKTGKTVILKQ